MGAALVAPGEALVDAVTVRLVGNDEDAAVGESGRGGKQEGTGNECGGKSHGDTGRGKGSPRTDKPKGLIMINHGPAGGSGWRGFGD